MLDREHRSRIFDKILKDIEEGNNGKRLQPREIGKTADVIPDQVESLRLKAERAARHGDHATAAQEFERALQIAARNSGSNPVGLIELYLAHVANLQQCGDYEKAGEALDRAQAVVDTGASISLSEQQVRIKAARGMLAFLLGDIEASEGHYVKALNLYEEACTVDAVRLAQLRSELGGVYSQAGLYDNALEIVLEAVAALEACSEPAPEDNMRLFKQLANIAFRKEESNAAVNHLLEAYRFAQEVDSPTELIELEVTLATVYTQHGEYDTAREWYQAAISHQEKMEITARWPLSLLYSSLALVQSCTEQNAEAVDCFARSLDLQLSHLAVTQSGLLQSGAGSV